jgi:cysteine-rich repeat protein
MLLTLRIGAVVLAGGALIAAQPAMAAPAPAAACAMAKEKALGLDLLKKLKCYSKAAKDGAGVDPSANADLSACLAAIDAKTTASFGSAEAAGGCAQDANAFDVNVDTIPDGQVGSILNQINNGFRVNATTLGYRGLNGPVLNPPAGNQGTSYLVAPGLTASKCAKKQFIALAVLAKKFYFCEKKEISKGIADDPACISKAVEVYDKKFAKSLEDADCINTADGTTLAGYQFQLFNLVTPNVPRLDGCGNGLVTNGMSGTTVETCDDGNTNNFDGCPSDCVVDACTPTATPRTATLVIAGPDVANVASLTVELDYPEGKVELPGTGFGPASIVDLTGSASFDSVDFDHALRVVVSNDIAFGTTSIAELDFVDCQAAPVPVPADFVPCNVTGAFGAGGVDEFTATTTCSVTIP